MKKSELKTGMVVETEAEVRYQVMLKTPYGDIFQAETPSTKWSSFMPLSLYNEDLLISQEGYEGLWDVMKVWGTASESARAYRAPLKEYTTLLWERPKEVKEIDSRTAIEMLEKALGCKVKIVK